MSTDSAAFAGGSIPENYDQGLGPVIFEAHAQETASRAAVLSPKSILELACGTGRVTRALRSAVPRTTRLVATDLSESMLDYARTLGTKDVEWRVADAQDLPFQEGTFDLVVFQFGLMFVPDKTRCLEEIHRVLRPGGTALVAVWDTMDHLFRENKRLLEAQFPDNPPKLLDVPFSMHDPEANRELFEQAFSDVIIEPVEKNVQIEDPDAVARGCILGNPVANQIMERDPEAPALLIEKLTEYLRHNSTANLRAWLITAKKGV